MKKKYLEGRELFFLQDFSDGIEINVISGLLKTNGIPHYVESPNIGQISGYCSDPVPRYILFVELENAILTKELIYQYINSENDEAFNEYRWNLRKRQNRMIFPIVMLFFVLLSFLMFYYSGPFPGFLMLGPALFFLFILLCSERARYDRE